MADTMALIVMSHGDYAAGAMQSAEMILGPQENYRTVSLTPDQGREDVVAAVEEAAAQLDTARGLLLLVDMKGGTPGNAAGQLVLTREDVYAYCGFNLSMLLECLASRDEGIATMAENMRQSFDASYCDLAELLRGGE